MRTVAFLLMVGLLTVPALGDSVNLATELGTQYTGTWTLQASSNAATSAWTGDFDMGVVSSVYQTSGSDQHAAGTLAFVYELSPNTDGVFALNLDGDFSSYIVGSALALHTHGTVGEVSLGLPSFNFDGNMSVFIGFGSLALDSNETLTITFLVDAGTDWALYAGNALNAGATEGYAYAPGAVVPEPATLTLLGIGLLGGGMARFRKRFQ